MAEDTSSDKEIDLLRGEGLSSVNSCMSKACKMSQKEVKRVCKEKEAIDMVANKELEHVPIHFPKTINLNVGGQHFTTSLETLIKDANSMLHVMFSGRFDTKPDKDGSYFIDRDGTYFRYILNYLRSGRLVLPEDDTIQNEVLIEAEFYQIQGIIDELHPFTESSILSLNQRKILKCWFRNEHKPPPQFVLLFRASRDGCAASNFHSHCDDKGATITIVKSGNNIFGGYADVSWDSSGTYKECTKSFLFSLVNPAGTGSTKIPLIVGLRGKGINCNSDSGPTFGTGFDLHISDAANENTDSCSNLGNTYECLPSEEMLTGDTYFSVDDYEVFGYQEG